MKKIKEFMINNMYVLGVFYDRVNRRRFHFSDNNGSYNQAQ